MGTSDLTITRKKILDGVKVRDPRHCKVVMFNDDVTTQDFVVMVLSDIFHIESKVAYRLMMKIHTQGRAVVYESSYDDCYSRVCMVSRCAKEYGFPLRVIVER